MLPLYSSHHHNIDRGRWSEYSLSTIENFHPARFALTLTRKKWWIETWIRGMASYTRTRRLKCENNVLPCLWRESSRQSSPCMDPQMILLILAISDFRLTLIYLDVVHVNSSICQTRTISGEILASCAKVQPDSGYCCFVIKDWDSFNEFVSGEMSNSLWRRQKIVFRSVDEY